MKYGMLLKAGAATTALAAAMIAAAPAMAQSSSEPDGAAQTTEEQDPAAIVVTGIRGSLQRAAEVKRDANQVEDVITAEDVGKLPDANVAEALQRVTGVQITRVFGEGQAVSVRGLQQVRIEVDGRTLLGWSARLSPPENDQLGRSSGLDSVPSSVFGRLEVRKSPLASQAEGGLGGTVNLVTPKPFDFHDTRISIRGQGTYSEGAKKFEPGFTGLFSTHLGDRIGILVSAEYQKRTSEIETLERNDFNNRNYTLGPTGTALGRTDVYQTPVLFQYENFNVDRSRFGINGSIQFKATPEWTITADTLYSFLKTSRRQDFISFRVPTTNNPVSNYTLEDNFVVAGTTGSGTLTTAGQQRNEPTRSTMYGLNSTYDNGHLTIAADGYYSRGTIDQTIQIITLQNVPTVFGTFDFRGAAVPSLKLTTTGGAAFDPTLVSNYKLASNGVRSNRLLGVLQEYTGKLDLAYKTDGGLTFSTGIRYTDLGSTSHAYRSQVTAPFASVQPFLAVTDGSKIEPDLPNTFPHTYLSTIPDTNFIYTTAQAAQPNPDPNARSALLPNDQRDYNLTERTIAGYGMVSLETMLGNMPVRGNIGLRVAHTSLSVLSNQVTAAGTSPVVDKNSYTKALPRANIAFNLTHDFLVRFSASKTIQRASIADLAPSRFFNATALTVTGGNAQLRPPTATNFDVSFEYYTGKSSLISGAVFYKSVKDFIANFSFPAVDLTYDPSGRELQFTVPGNIATAKIKGFEVGFQQFFDFLPSPFNGLGVIANFTYSDSHDSSGFPLVAVSKTSYNLVGLYEKGPVSARIAYNWRDKAVFQFNEGRPSYIGARSQLDAQLGFDITRQFQLQLNVQNLSPADSATVEYSVIPDALNSYSLSERRYTIGLRAKF